MEPITSNGSSGDDILAVDSEDENTASVTGGLGEDTILVGNLFGDDDTNITAATVFGGEGISSPNDGDDLILVQAGTALIYGNGGDDSIAVEVEDGATIYGGLADDTIDVFSEDDASLVVFGGENDDSITVDTDGGDVTVYGGTGVSDPLDGDDTIAVGLNADDSIVDSSTDNALVYGNGGDDSIDVLFNVTASVYGGAGDDTITVDTTGDETATLQVFGGHDEDVIDVSAGAVTDDANGDVTVYGGEGVTDPTDGDDTIGVGVEVIDSEGPFDDASLGDIDTTLFENALVYGNGGEDLIGVAVTESATVYGGGDDDTIDVTQVDAEDADDVGDVSVFGGAGEDIIDVETGSAEATVSGGETLDATQNTSNGEDLSITHNGNADAGDPDDDEDDVPSTSGEFLLVGSTGDDAFAFDGVDGDAVEIRLGGGTDDVEVSGDTDTIEFTVDDGELDEADLGGADGTFDEDAGTVTFTFDGVDVTLVGITEFNEVVTDA